MPSYLIPDDQGYERLVFGEVLIPGAINVYGDLHTKENVKQFAYQFMAQGLRVNVHHDTPDLMGEKLTIVESFIAREGDQDFIEGSWVLGVHIWDDELWASIINNELTGFSYEAVVNQVGVEVAYNDALVRQGYTEPDMEDGHSHPYIVFLDDDGRVVTGGTGIVNGHTHDIERATVTEEGDFHTHLFNFTHQELVL